MISLSRSSSTARVSAFAFYSALHTRVSSSLSLSFVFAPRYKLFCSRLREIGCNCVRARGGRRDRTGRGDRSKAHFTNVEAVFQANLFHFWPVFTLVLHPRVFRPCRCMANASLRRTKRYNYKEKFKRTRMQHYFYWQLTRST